MGKEVYIVNVKGTSGEKPKDFDSNSNADNWLEYWDINSSNPIPKHCANKRCNKEIKSDEEMVGAHVYECIILNNNGDCISSSNIYIVPLCKSCNGKEGYNSNNIVSPEDVMVIDEDYLVPHPKYKKKK